ncbi:MAG TPA: PaaI family thioesterase [Terricaulis sp.]|nr:PaaI family thioesterase [Terricaulis sp.]
MSEDSPAGYGEGETMLERVRALVHFTPLAVAMGIELTRVERAKAWGKAPYKPEFVGDPDTGVIAGGVLTAFLDQVCGTAVVAAMDDPVIIATIDLRIDYMRPATPGRDVLAMAHCYKIGKSVAFVRAVAYEDDPENPIAHAVSAFMINSSGGRKFGANFKEPRK